MRGESYLGHSNRGSQRTTETAGAYPPVLLLITYLIDTNLSKGAEVGSPPCFAARIPHEGSLTSCIAGRGACRHAIGPRPNIRVTTRKVTSQSELSLFGS
jgi:hypothetical protein